MKIQNTRILTTPRLHIEALRISDNEFIFDLVNTPGWLRFIGNRFVPSPTEAIGYIRKILDNPNVSYWVVRTKGDMVPIGVVTFIKRDYLDHPDIGFAFLPQFASNGYAHEAARAVLDEVLGQHLLPRVLATTNVDNESSIRLLRKLGLTFEREIEVNGEKLFLYSMAMGE